VNFRVSEHKENQSYYLKVTMHNILVQPLSGLCLSYLFPGVITPGYLYQARFGALKNVIFDLFS